ncbi:MAG TPA: cytidylate kinase-like family protein [Candidatus Fusicatenibacter intestinigallinarum]|uniref:Cytidylate kinase-like family protein n=1 Tax=Candidatus Fusicatenibacter intestinigallinarum TaxID=2838598 RepID=A0A9D2NAC6_9FIRM|nr:cytidylate kinase-like family protein [Candidatus Fusicatenibacter intestinigallinarum]
MGVITIGRQYGSNGRRIARALADRMGVHFYDKELIRLASERSDIPYEELQKVDEQRANPWRYPVDEKIQMENRFRFYPMNDMLFDTEKKIIEELAAREDCVIVGRCANRILKGMDSCVSVFVYAPMEVRVQTIMKRAAINAKEARSLIRRIDKQREYYYNYFTDGTWDDMDEYDFCLDSSRVSVEQAAEILEHMYHTIVKDLI